jgi:hypothetical protein
MGLLGEIYSFGNRTRNKLRGLLDDPKGYLQQTADQTANTLRDMTGANETAQQFALRDKINAGDKNALEQYRNLEKTIQNKLFDVALNFNPAAVGMFIGKGAKTWDAAAAAEAEKRLAAGDDARKVWSELGVFRGPDGHLRQEIPDNKSFYRGSKAAGSSYAEEVATHPELYKNYPSLGSIRVKEFDGLGGGINNSASVMDIGLKGGGNETAMHELQHAIQQREGWARGGSPDEFEPAARSYRTKAIALENSQDGLKRAIDNGGVDPQTGGSIDNFNFNINRLKNAMSKLETTGADRDPMWQYRHLAGEAEARATQARMNMDMAQRRATFPLDSYDVPANQLIIRGGLLK